MKAKNKLVILPAAQEELEEIANTHMALVGAASAKKIGKRIHDAIGRLCDHPQMGIAFPDGELSRAGYRRLICGNYICVYRLIGDAVCVYHVADGRTNYKRIFQTLPEDV